MSQVAQRFLFTDRLLNKVARSNGFFSSFLSIGRIGPMLNTLIGGFHRTVGSSAPFFNFGRICPKFEEARSRVLLWRPRVSLGRFSKL